MPKAKELSALKSELKQKLAEGGYDVLFERLLKWVRRLFPLPHGYILPSFALGFSHLILSVLLISFEGSALFTSWLPLNIITAVVVYIGVFLYAALFRQFYTVLRESVIDSFTRPEDIRDLSRWLEWFSNPYWLLLLSVLYAAGLAAYVRPIFLAEYGYFGWFGTVGIFTFQIPLAVVMHHCFVLMFFPLLLSRYQIDLYELDPGETPSIRQLSAFIRNSAYILSLYVTLFTFYLDYVNVPIFPLMLVYMPPVLGIFITRQIGFSRMVARARSVVLDRLRNQIEALDIERHFDNPSLFNQFNAAMSYYERVKNAGSSVFDWRVGVTLFNSLLLPCTAFILTHYDKIRAFFGW